MRYKGVPVLVLPAGRWTTTTWRRWIRVGCTALSLCSSSTLDTTLSAGSSLTPGNAARNWTNCKSMCFYAPLPNQSCTHLRRLYSLLTCHSHPELPILPPFLIRNSVSFQLFLRTLDWFLNLVSGGWFSFLCCVCFQQWAAQCLPCVVCFSPGHWFWCVCLCPFFCLPCFYQMNLRVNKAACRPWTCPDIWSVLIWALLIEERRVFSLFSSLWSYVNHKNDLSETLITLAKQEASI